MGVIYRKTVTVSASDVDGVAAAQMPVGAGDLTLTADPVIVPNGGQFLSITSDADDSGATIIITGTDPRGAVQVWTGAAPNAATYTIALPFATVVSAHIDMAAVGNISLGWIAKGLSLPLPLDMFSTPFNVSLTLEHFTGAGTPEASVWFTQDKVQGYEQNPAPDLDDLVWFVHPTLTAQTAAGTGNFAYPVVACALYLDGKDQAASVELIVIQSQ